ncbi:pitrilysin family protein [Geitlerinema splendidum]|nr:pitrilysin family protein [Geitlerinema splendidum]
MTSALLKSPHLPRLNAPKRHRLPNGLMIVAEQMPVEAVNLSLWLNVGSAVESNEINGMAHFLEHMVFKGTAKLQSGEFERLIEERGAVTNAATSQDYTHFYITTAPKDFAELAPFQLDVVLNPSIPDEAFERERLVVLEEIRRSDDNPRRRTYLRSMELAFEQLPYRRPVLGPTANIEQLTAQQMRDFHGRWYQPQSVTAVAVGNLPVEELIEIVAQSCESALGHSAPTHRPWEEVNPSASLPLPSEGLQFQSETPYTEVVRQELSDRTLTQARLIMVWRVPGALQLEETYGFDVLASILGQGRTSRLVQDLREDRGLVTSIFASNMTYLHQGLFYISAQLPVENVPVVEQAILDHLKTLQTSIQPSEIARVRAQVANRFIFGNETPSDRASLYGYYQSVLGDLAPALHYPHCIQSLEVADLQATAQTYLSTEAYGVLVVRPE